MCELRGRRHPKDSPISWHVIGRRRGVQLETTYDALIRDADPIGNGHDRWHEGMLGEDRYLNRSLETIVKSQKKTFFDVGRDRRCVAF